MQVLHSGPVGRSHVNPLCLGLEELYNCVYRTCSLSCIQVSLSRLQEDLYAGLKELCTGSVKALPLHRACIAHRILSPLLEATAKADEVLQRFAPGLLPFGRQGQRVRVFGGGTSPRTYASDLFSRNCLTNQSSPKACHSRPIECVPDCQILFQETCC